MTKDHLIEIGILAFSTLLAPLLPLLVGFIVNRSRQRRKRHRQPYLRQLQHEAKGSPETGWARLPFVFLLTLLLSLSLDIYVAVRQAGRSDFTAGSTLLNNLTILIAAWQTMAITFLAAFLAAFPIIRTKYQTLLTELRDHKKAHVEVATLQRRFDARDRAVLKAINKDRDAQAVRQRESDAREKALVEALTKALDERTAAYAELIRISNLHPQGLTAPSQEPLPERKSSADLKRRRHAPRVREQDPPTRPALGIGLKP